MQKKILPVPKKQNGNCRYLFICYLSLSIPFAKDKIYFLLFCNTKR